MTAPSGHAKAYGASGSSTWMTCAGSVVLQQGKRDSGSIHSARGTVEHTVASDALLVGYPLTNASVDEIFEQDGHTITFDDEMAAATQTYVDLVRDLRDTLGAELLVEQRLQYGPMIGVDDPDSGWGTGDAVLIAGDEIIVVDYKGGRGVEVEAEGNTQLQLYALGALHKFGEFGEFKTVRNIIVQPRAGGVKEWTQTVEELLAFAELAKAAVERCETAQYADEAELIARFLQPGEKQCRWCKAAATCPALRAEVVATTHGNTAPATPEEFADLVNPLTPDANWHADESWLSAAMQKAPLIEHWLKAIRAEVERRLLAGEPVPGFKLVQGKAGNRAWSDEQAAEEMLRKRFRLKVEEAFDLKLISPTSAEKLLKADSPKRWASLQPLITRADGKPSVAPETDNRPALTIGPVADEFDTVVSENPAGSDEFA